jgi:SAM-dependent methyltransferase
MLDAGVLEFVRAALPPPGERVLEVGAGAGELADALRAVGHDVLAIDPEPDGPGVVRSALHELDAPPGGFGAAVAVVSLHHVEPLEPSLRRLAELVRPGGALVVDELDVGALDERAAAWWLARRPPVHEHEPTPAALVAEMRGHIHALAVLRDALEPWFEVSAVERGPYLHRWHLPPGHLQDELAAIATGAIPAIGARMTGARR